MTADQHQGLAEGTRVLHIGPHKTGTTTVQAAFHQSRDRLASFGVHYAGARAHSMTAAIGASTNRRLPTNTAAAGLTAWRALADEVRTATARHVVLSSEFYCEADPDRIRAIVDELGGSDRVHVVITLRPLVNILSSQWQQYIQNRATASYDAWLRGVLSEEPTRMTPTFWQRHRHDALVSRWAEVVGPHNVTAIILDEHDPGMLLRSFEDLLQVDPGTLIAENVAANRSLTWAEVELIRSFNRDYVDQGMSFADYTELIRFGAARHLQTRRPDDSEIRLATPQWAIDRALQVGAEMVAAIAQSGVSIVGSTHALAAPERLPLAGDNPVLETVPDHVAASFLAGVAIHLGAVRGLPPDDVRALGPIEAAVRERHRRRRITTHLERTTQEIAAAKAKLAPQPSLARRVRRRIVAWRPPRDQAR